MKMLGYLSLLICLGVLSGAVQGGVGEEEASQGSCSRNTGERKRPSRISHKPTLERRHSWSERSDEACSPSGLDITVLSPPPDLQLVGERNSSVPITPVPPRKARSVSPVVREESQSNRVRPSYIPEMCTFLRPEIALRTAQDLGQALIQGQGGVLHTLVIGTLPSWEKKEVSYKIITRLLDFLCWKEKEEDQEYKTNPGITTVVFDNGPDFSIEDCSMVVYECTQRFPNLKQFAFRSSAELKISEASELLPGVEIFEFKEFYKTLRLRQSKGQT